jgi:sugar phosphate isomerase/epimerase
MPALGLVSAILANHTLEEVIQFASRNGFACVELMCWPRGKAERRYAGVTHLDVDTLDQERIATIRSLLRENRVTISGLGYYPNLLDPDEEKREFCTEHLKKVIRAAGKLGVPIVNTFIGRDPRRNIADNLRRYQEHWPAIVKVAEENNVRIGIENCPMLFTNDEWPGGTNLAISPAVWERMFELIPSRALGLNYDPSHLVWQQMNYLQPLHDFRDRLYHIHLKDAQLHREQLDRVGILATPLEYHSPRIPGRGDVNWRAFFATLKEVGYDGAVCLEVEDKAYESSAEKITEAILTSRNFLYPFLERSREV